MNGNGVPAVAKIMDYNKYRYEKQKKLKESQKKAREANKELKEYQLSLKNYSILNNSIKEIFKRFKY